MLLTAGVGALIALQAPINGGLGRSIGTWQAAFLSFAIGTVLVRGFALLAGGLGSLSGAGGVTAATIAGQLTMSLVVDQLGLLGVERQPITVAKVLGVVLLALGVLLIVRD